MKAAFILLITTALTFAVAANNLPSCDEIWSEDFKAVLNSVKKKCGGINLCYVREIKPLLQKMAKEKKDAYEFYDSITIKGYEKGSWQEAVITQTKACPSLISKPLICFLKISKGRCSII